MFAVEDVYKSADVVSSTGNNFTMSEGEEVEIVLANSGEVIEGFITKLLANDMEIKIRGEIGVRKFSYEDDIAKIKLQEDDI